MAEHWRDLHRHPSGKFLPRPGAKGFRETPPKDDPNKAPPATAVDKTPQQPGLSKWVDRNRSKR